MGQPMSVCKKDELGNYKPLDDKACKKLKWTHLVLVIAVILLAIALAIAGGSASKTSNEEKYQQHQRRRENYDVKYHNLDCTKGNIFDNINELDSCAGGANVASTIKDCKKCDDAPLDAPDNINCTRRYPFNYRP